MEKINTKPELVERLKDVLAVEMRARADYIDDLSRFEDKRISAVIQAIKQDEDKHVALLNSLIMVLE